MAAEDRHPHTGDSNAQGRLPQNLARLIDYLHLFLGVAAFQKDVDMGDTVKGNLVRVPVFCGHSESVNIETEKKLTAKDVKAILREAPGVLLCDEPEKNVYPMPIDCVGKDATLVGRIREDDSVPNGINLWIVADR